MIKKTHFDHSNHSPLTKPESFPEESPEQIEENYVRAALVEAIG